MPDRSPTEPCVNKMKWEYFCKFSAVCLLQLHRAQKRKHYFEQSKPLLTSGLWLLKQFLVTRVHLALIFSLFPVNFELSIHSYRLTGSDVLAQTKVSNVACFWPANRDVCFLFFWCVVRILHSIRYNNSRRSLLSLWKNLLMLLAVRISSYGCTSEVWRALKKLELPSAAPRATLAHFSCSPNFPRASITRYTQGKHEQILNYR